MIMNGITRGLLLGLLAAALCGTGYYLGHGRAEALGLAELNAFKVAREEEKRRDAETHAHALAEAMEDYQAEVARGNRLEQAINAEKVRRTKETQNLRRQIANAAKNSAVTLSPDIVRLLNNAAGAGGIPEASLPGTLCPPGADGGTGACADPGARVLDFAGVSEADLAAWFIHYAGRCQSMEDKLSGWRELYRSRADAQGGKK